MVAKKATKEQTVARELLYSELSENLGVNATALISNCSIGTTENIKRNILLFFWLKYFQINRNRRYKKISSGRISNNAMVNSMLCGSNARLQDAMFSKIIKPKDSAIMLQSKIIEKTINRL
ncbi:MAG: hypothetical protein IKL28_10410 [Lachnospiraceae bacterium]|nr:hypothetical protein [Lachnospiraceae bacterium]